MRFPRPAELDVPVYFLRIEVDILKGQDVWERLIDRICGEKANADPLLLQQMVG